MKEFHPQYSGHAIRTNRCVLDEDWYNALKNSKRVYSEFTTFGLFVSSSRFLERRAFEAIGQHIQHFSINGSLGITANTWCKLLALMPNIATLVMRDTTTFRGEDLPIPVEQYPSVPFLTSLIAISTQCDNYTMLRDTQCLNLFLRHLIPHRKNSGLV